MSTGLAGAPPLSPPPAVPAGPDTIVYRCDCEGFRLKRPTKFCLRCLSVWVEGLPGVFRGKRLEQEMRRAAGILARHLRDDPSLGRLTVNDALNAPEDSL